MVHVRHADSVSRVVLPAASAAAVVRYAGRGLGAAPAALRLLVGGGCALALNVAGNWGMELRADRGAAAVCPEGAAAFIEARRRLNLAVRRAHGGGDASGYGADGDELSLRRLLTHPPLGVRERFLGLATL